MLSSLAALEESRMKLLLKDFISVSHGCSILLSMTSGELSDFSLCGMNVSFLSC